MKTELSLIARTLALSFALGVAALPALAQSTSPPPATSPAPAATSTLPGDAGDHANAKATGAVKNGKAAKDSKNVKAGKAMKDAKNVTDSKTLKTHEQTAQHPASDTGDTTSKTGAGKQ